MKLFIKLIIISYLIGTWSLAADFQIRSTTSSENNAAVAYNSANDEYLVVWQEWNTSGSSVLGQRIKGDGTSLIGSPFTISPSGIPTDHYSSIAYNSQANEYLVIIASQNGIAGQRVSNSGQLVGSTIQLMQQSGFLYPKIVYNTLGNNYLLVGAEMIALNNNDQANIKIHTRKILSNGQPTGTEHLIREQPHGNFSDGARFSVAYAPITSTETPTGRYLLAIDTPADLTMLDDNGVIVSKVVNSSNGTVVDNHIPFQQSKVGTVHNLDIAFGYWMGENVFMIVWGDRNQSINSQEWTGIWAGIVNATPIEYDANASVSNTVFPVSSIWAHWATPEAVKSWKPVVAYNKIAGKFMIAWRETPSTDSNNDTKVNHIRANAVKSSTIPPPANVVLSAVVGNEDPTNPAIAASTKNANALVVWEDARNSSTKDIDLYGNLFQTTGAKTLTLISPNGGEMWGIGTQQKITWQSTGVGNNDVSIEYSTNYGATYNFIAFKTNIDGANTYTWTVPNTPSTQCFVKISVSGLSDESDAQFTIVEPKITIVEPNGGEKWYVGSTQQIWWNNYYFNDAVKIEFSIDGGSSYSTIITSTANSGIYSWTIPNTPSTNCIVRVSDAADGVPSDVSDAVFTIVAAKLTITSPNGGENWGAGTIQNITWTSQNIPDNDVSIEYSTDNGNSYTFVGVLTNNQPTESFEWTVPATPSTQCLIRISLNMQGSEIVDISDAPFTISQITVISPNGGEIWKSNPYNISCSGCLPTIYFNSIDWNSSNFSGAVRIDLRGVDSNGKYFSRILANNYPNIGGIIVMIDTNIFKPGEVVFPLNVKIRVADAQKKSVEYSDNYDDKIFDWSDNDFIIIDSDKNTSTGNNVVVNFSNNTAITFDNVTGEGNTTLKVLPTGTPPPNGFEVFPANTPQYYNIETTAEFSGNIELRMNYNDSSLTSNEESKLRLYVYETASSTWQDITTSVDSDSNFIFGNVSHLSEFAIMLPTIDNTVAPNNLWVKFYSNYLDGWNGKSEAGNEVINTLDGGFAMFGHISFGGANTDLRIIKTDANGDTIWTRNHEGGQYAVVNNALSGIQLQDRSYIVCGYSNANLQLFHVDATGNPIWETTYFYPDSYNCGASAITSVKNGTFIITGWTNIYGEGDQLFLSKADTSGNIIWSKDYGGSGNDGGGEIIRLSSGGYIVVGSTVSFGAGANDIYLLKINEDGDTLWTRTYGGASEDWGIDVRETPDHGLLILGATRSFSPNPNYSKAYLIRTNSSGDTLWTKLYKNFNYDDVLNRMTPTLDGGYVLAGNSWDQIWVVKINSLGDTVWTSKYDIGTNEYATSIKETGNGEYIITGGVKFGPSANPYNTFLLKLGHKTTELANNTREIPQQFLLEQNYPNPFNPTTKINYSVPILYRASDTREGKVSDRMYVSLKVYDILGREVATLVNKQQTIGYYEVEFNASSLPSGIYLYRLQVSVTSNSKEFVQTKKMILLK